MPLFEYHCKPCHKDFTLLQSADVNKEETVCTACNTPAQYRFSTFASKVSGSTKGKAKPVTEDDYPNKDIFKLPIPRLLSDL